jgi:hypothetical protein
MLREILRAVEDLAETGGDVENPVLVVATASSRRTCAPNSPASRDAATQPALPPPTTT